MDSFNAEKQAPEEWFMPEMPKQKILKKSKKKKHRSKKDTSYRGNPNWAGDD